jgi:ABC-2 type transport system permease protein
MMDLRRWRRRPIAIAGAIIPPLSMALLLVVLSLTVTQEPVALVVQSHGPEARRVQKLIKSDTDAYELTETNRRVANQMLQSQEIAAILIIPPDFDAHVALHTAHLQLMLNNVDIDFSDDIRRSVDRTVGRFNGPGMASSNTNPYHIRVEEHDLRRTNVDFLHYQTLPVLILLLLNVGLMGTALLCAEDREQGTARVLALTPAPGWVLAAGRLLGGVLASLAVLIPTVILGLLTHIVSPPHNHWLALIALFLATALCASSLGVILGTLLHGSRNTAMACSVLSTYLFFLGGGFTTVAFLPEWLRVLSALNPVRYAIDGLRQALFYPGLTGFAGDMSVLIGTAAATTLLASVLIPRLWRR